MTKKKTETQQETESVIDGLLVEKLDAWRTEEIKRENSHVIVDLIDYLSTKVYPDFKNKDTDKELKAVRKYILASYPFDESLGISRNAYDVMNSRISRGGQLVFHKRITIADDKLKDKKGNRLIISKVEDMHNKFINKPTKDKPTIEIEEAEISNPPIVEESNHKPETYVEFSNDDERVEETINYLNSILNLTETDFNSLLADRNLNEYLQENIKPIEHRISKILGLGKTKSKKVA